MKRVILKMKQKSNREAAKKGNCEVTRKLNCKANRFLYRFAVGLFALLFGMILFSQEAFADVMWEPRDSFYELHRDECDYVNRLYTANGPDGEVIAYKSPENSGIVKKYENDTQIRIIHIFTDKKGVEWGVYEISERSADVLKNETGWVPMEYLKPVYDYICFEEEFGEEIVSEKGAVDKRYLGLQVYFWYAPGSTEGNTVVLTGYTPEYSETYIDEEGRKWGYIIYYMGYRNKWICLDNPQADYDTLWQEEAPELGENLKEPEFGTDRIVPGGSVSGGLGLSVAIAVGLVVAVVCVTVWLLKRLKSRNIL